MKGRDVMWGAVGFCIVLIIIGVSRKIGKYFGLPEVPKEHWILIAFILGMVFIKVFQFFCMNSVDRFKEELKKQNEEDGYEEKKSAVYNR